MPRITRCVALLILVVLAAPPALSADDAGAPPALLRPRAIVIHVHVDVSDRRFLPRLEAQLSALLTAPVLIVDDTFDLQPLRPDWGKLDASEVFETYARTRIDWRNQASVMHFLLIADDMRRPPARYNFAVSAGDATTAVHLGIVSLHRLQETAWRDGQDEDPVLTASRVFKMIAKNTAKMAGYRSGDRCLLAFPNSLGALDAMPESFCEPDSTALARAGIVR